MILADSRPVTMPFSTGKELLAYLESNQLNDSLGMLSRKAESDLLSKLRQGRLTMVGRPRRNNFITSVPLKNGNYAELARIQDAPPGDMEKILAQAFADLCFVDHGSPMAPIAVPINFPVGEFPSWNCLRLESDDVFRIWPLAHKGSEPNRPRGRKPAQRERVKTEMRRLDPSELASMKEEAMAVQFQAARDTCRRARNEVLVENNSRQIPTIDN
jgi:hypothetical protein